MKCVLFIGSNKITRVSDDIANNAVANKKAVFVKKEAFKEQERGSYVPGKQESTMSNVEKRKKGIFSKKRIS